jgi:hypothetical protein
VDHAAAKLDDALERALEIRDGEVRQREAVARPSPALVQAQNGGSGVRLQALPLGVATRFERELEQRLPETACATQVVGGKLDQSGRDAYTIRAALFLFDFEQAALELPADVRVRDGRELEDQRGRQEHETERDGRQRRAAEVAGRGDRCRAVRARQERDLAEVSPRPSASRAAARPP